MELGKMTFNENSVILDFCYKHSGVSFLDFKYRISVLEYMNSYEISISTVNKSCLIIISKTGEIIMEYNATKKNRNYLIKEIGDYLNSFEFN